MQMTERDKYDEKGYVVLRGIFSESEMQALEQQVDRIYDQWLTVNQSDAVEYSLINMHSLTSAKYFETSPPDRISFFEAIASKKLTEQLNAIFGNGLYFHNSQLFFNPHDGDRDPYWHRDIQYNPIEEETQREQLGEMLNLHIRIPLIGETGVELVPGTHKRWDTELERNVRLEIDGHRNSEALPGAELTHLEVGDILIFSANMIHRGNYALNKSRKALDLCVGKAHFLTSRSVDPSVLPTDEEMPKITNSDWYRCARELAVEAGSERSPVES